MFTGKTVLLQASILRDAQRIVADHDSGTNHLQILCVWQEGADALIQQYRELAIPQSDNLQKMVFNKKELMNKFRATVQAFEPTTDQINAVCRNITQLEKDKEVYVYIDECWLTAPKKFDAHLTQVSFSFQVI